MPKQKELNIPERKTKRIELRVTNRNFQIIEKFAKKSGMNRSEYLEARGIKRTYMKTNNIPEPDYAHLMLNFRELRAQGNNLNQLTRAVHVARLQGDIVVVDDSMLQAAIAANLQAREAIVNVVKQR